MSDASERVTEILFVFSLFQILHNIIVDIRTLLVRQASRRGNLSSVHKEKDHFSTNLNTTNDDISYFSSFTNQSSKETYENGI